MALAAVCLVHSGIGPQAASAADDPPAASATAAVPNPWATGGGPGSAPLPTGAPPPVTQAWAMPATVIHGGAIPAGWQPQPIPYSGIGADGKPMTVYVAPTYTFTFVAGPPVLAAAAVPTRTQVNRIQASPTPAVQPGWNYQTQGAPLASTTLPAYTRSAPVPYQYPAGAPALAGQPLSPPATPAAPAPTFVQSPVAPPPAPAPSLAAPPTQWVSVPPTSAPR